VLGYLNYTLASNNNNSASTSASQGGVEPSGSANLFPIQDSDGIGNIDTTATTQFVADKNIVSSERMLSTQIDRLVFDSSSDLTSQEIKTFLSKPVSVATGNFSTTDTFSTFPGTNNPSNLLFNTIYSNKVSGYLGFRATTVFRIVVNATRFQQGRYIMAHLPLGGADASDASTATWVNDHLATMVQRTTVPHVEIDLCCDTEATIRIPYNSALNFFPFGSLTSANDYGSLGWLFVYPYVALTDVSGTGTAGFTVYGYFEDVELVAAAVPQSGRGFTSVKRSKNETDKEQDSVGMGPISSSLIKVRDASTILARVPLLSAYANSVSWFADIGASAAKVFGWSKPANLQVSQRVTQNYLPYAANTDGPDNSFPLSLSQTNSVGTAVGFSGTDVDEMDFSFLATIPAWSFTLPWTTAQVTDTTITSLGVGCGGVAQTVVNGGTFNHYIPYQFIASHFQFWRGSMVFKLKFVKTEFHSGRLSITFSPFCTDVTTATTPNLANSSYLHRQIIDIRETNEFTFVIPFISVTPYKKNAASTGLFSITVLEPLKAPSTVSSTVNIIIERAAGPDFEVAVPVNNPLQYFAGITPQSGGNTSVDVGSNECSHFDSTIGSSAFKSDNYLNSLHCIGERISSLRTLLKLPCQLINNVVPTANLYIHTQPFAISSGTVAGAVNTSPSVLNDFYSRFASCYVYSRGGVRLKYLDNTAVTSPNPIAIYLDTRPATNTIKASVVTYSATDAVGTTFSASRLGVPVVYYKAGYSGEVQIPQYLRFHSRLNSDCVANAINLYNNNVRAITGDLTVTRQFLPNAASDAGILRSGSDDLNFGGFLSVPPMFAYAV
jgi:hypothetical protein